MDIRAELAFCEALETSLSRLCRNGTSRIKRVNGFVLFGRPGMLCRRSLVLILTFFCASGGAARAFAQTPADYQSVLTTLARAGDFKDGVLKVNIPRSDLKVSIGQRSAPTPFGFGGWVAMTKGTGGMDVMMGDLVLTEDEVNPVMSKLL